MGRENKQSTTIEAYVVGSRVKLSKETEGIITGICLRGTPPNIHIKYEVTWWNGEDKKSDWFDPVEISHLYARSIPKFSIGFRENLNGD